MQKVSGSDAIARANQQLQDVAEQTGVAIEDILKVDSALGELDAELAAVITDKSTLLLLRVHWKRLRIPSQTC